MTRSIDGCTRCRPSRTVSEDTDTDAVSEIRYAYLTPVRYLTRRMHIRDWTGAMRLAVPHGLYDSVFHASLIPIKQLTDQATRPRTASMALWLHGLSQSVFYCTAPPRLPLMTKYYM